MAAAAAAAADPGDYSGLDVRSPRWHAVTPHGKSANPCGHQLSTWHTIAGYGRGNLLSMLRALDPNGLTVPSVVPNVISKRVRVDKQQQHAAEVPTHTPGLKKLVIHDWEGTALRSLSSLHPLVNPSLRTLRLSSRVLYNDRAGRTLRTVLRERGANESLTELRLHFLQDPAAGQAHCELSVEAAQGLIECVRSLRRLRQLEITGAALAPGAMQALAEGLRRCTQLRSLLVTHTKVDVAGSRALGDAIAALPRLKVLSLEQCGLDGPSAANVMYGLHSNSSLVSLCLLGCPAVPRCASIRGLRELRVSAAALVDPSSFGSLPFLRELSIVFEGGDFVTEANAIGRIAGRLNKLWLHWKAPPSPDTISAVAAALAGAPQLRELRVSGLNPPVGDGLVPVVSKLPFLTKADLSGIGTHAHTALCAALATTSQEIARRRKEARILGLWALRTRGEGPLDADHFVLRDILGFIVPVGSHN
eukprot:Hpha_TRINITY_DN9209_c0_g2::TRINITY_DN9209_c0_g2_i1::g.28702::m.28702